MPKNPSPSEALLRAQSDVEPHCMYCRSSEGYAELLYTGDQESMEGFEVWFCCHRCRDAGQACETFYRIPTEKESNQLEMTGQKFRATLKRLGLTQKEAARRLGVTEDTLTARCKDAEVPALYRYALLGLEAESFKSVLDQLTNSIEQITVNSSDED